MLNLIKIIKNTRINLKKKKIIYEIFKIIFQI